MLRYKRLSNYYLFTILNVYPLLGGLALQIATIQVIQLTLGRHDKWEEWGGEALGLTPQSLNLPRLGSHRPSRAASLLLFPVYECANVAVLCAYLFFFILYSEICFCFPIKLLYLHTIFILLFTISFILVYESL